MPVRGFVAALGDQGPVRGQQHVFVNRRIVKDRTIAHAISDAYSVATIKERSPEVHLFIEIPPDRVDVNVHPTKAEVRFLEQSLVHEVLRRGLADALGQGRAPELQLTPVPGFAAGAAADDHSPASWRAPRSATAGAPSTKRRLRGFLPAAGPRRRAADGRSWQRLARRSSSGRPAMTPEDVRPMIPLGQFRDTFIIAVDDEGVAIMDQHVAHERVLFEQIAERLSAGRLESQRLLTPLLIELSPAQRQALAAHRDTLERFGMEVEEFGGDSLRLAAVPTLLEPAACEATVRALAEDLEGLDAARAPRRPSAASRRPWRAMRRSRRTIR